MSGVLREINQKVPHVLAVSEGATHGLLTGWTDYQNPETLGHYGVTKPKFITTCQTPATKH